MARRAAAHPGRAQSIDLKPPTAGRRLGVGCFGARLLGFFEGTEVRAGPHVPGSYKGATEEQWRAGPGSLPSRAASARHGGGTDSNPELARHSGIAPEWLEATNRGQFRL